QLFDTNAKVDQNTADITTNTDSINQNTTDIAANTASINQNTTDIATNTTNINSLSNSVTTLTDDALLWEWQRKRIQRQPQRKRQQNHQSGGRYPGRGQHRRR
ncbi:putative autotransporter, partial [Salmonella enterica subsp. enterica serovar Montevideo str. IA_2010008283]